MKKSYLILRNEQWLEGKYIKERLSADKIAERLGCTPRSVLMALRHFRIPIRTVQEAAKNRGHTFFPILNDKNWLYHKYVKDELSTRDIGSLIGCDEKTVFNALVSFDITLRKGAITDRTRKKMQDANSGENNYWYGKHLSKEHKANLREARKHQKMPKHHTKPELIFEAICKKHNLPFKYTGDGRFWIERINPDFIECNGKKIAVEVYGDYWHSPLLRPDMKEIQNPIYRMGVLKKYGWMLAAFWETDLLREVAEAFVLSELKKYGITPEEQT